MDRIQRRHWTSMANHVRLGAEAAEEIIEEISAEMPTVVEEATHRLPADFPKDLSDSILQGMVAQCESLKRQRPGV
jgi:serine/threonine-protein kinase HipA